MSYKLRRFLTKSLPTVAAAVATSFMLSGHPNAQLHKDEFNYDKPRYAEMTKSGDYKTYSWRRIKNVMGLKDANETSFYRRVAERYAELTNAYLDATKEGINGMPDFRSIFGIDEQRFLPSTRYNIPNPEFDVSLNIHDIVDMRDTRKLQRIIKKLTNRDGSWSVGNTRFFDGDRTIRTGRNSTHEPDGTVFRDPSGSVIDVRKYSGGSYVFNAALYDEDGDMLFDGVVLEHPYVVFTINGVGEKPLDNIVSGVGIFQKDVFEHIDVPVSLGPLYGADLRPKSYERGNIPKADAEMLQAYFDEVTSTIKAADEKLTKVQKGR